MYPKIKCHLTDKQGRILNPNSANSITYTAHRSSCLTSLCDKPAHKAPRVRRDINVSIGFYIALFAEGKIIAEPIFVLLEKCIELFAPEGILIAFATVDFSCGVYSPVNWCDLRGTIKVSVHIKAVAYAQARVDIIVPELDDKLLFKNFACIDVERIFDSVTLDCNGAYVIKLKPLKAVLNKYATLSDGNRRVYTDSDKITAYGVYGIPDPDAVSVYYLYVNGVLQPKENFLISKGRVELLTEDVPLKGATVILVFISFYSPSGRIRADSGQFTTLSDGRSKIYCEKRCSMCSGLVPSPEEVSFLDLYINGVLQPKSNYIVKKGSLILLTDDAPIKNAVISLAYTVLLNDNDMVIGAETSQYNAFAHACPIYADRDGIVAYGYCGIQPPENCSYHLLFVNGVIQPDMNYATTEGCLRLLTTDRPPWGAPIILKYLNIYTVSKCKYIEPENKKKACCFANH